ncbi:hypothetical protein Goari_004981 [Gossypium aridum]|uniref:Uncharacterized protein n=1 Tax=Gossypium aridum TaxID=34290 RepID=A0A7J8Y566_GOSAI|nr:hypothetical protein [Gossypium aridum]
MNVSLDKGNSTVCMVENVDPNARISSKIMKDVDVCDETHAKGGMLVPLNEVVKSSTHRLEFIASDGNNLMIEEEYGNKSDCDEK